MKVQELKTATGKTFLTISFDEHNNWIYNDWSGYVSPDNVMQGCLSVLEAIEKYKAPASLNDNRHLVGPWDQSVDWIEQEWTPRAVAAGLRYFAQVVDENSFAATSSADLLSKVQDRFLMRIFRDQESARDWLKECLQTGETTKD